MGLTHWSRSFLLVLALSFAAAPQGYSAESRLEACLRPIVETLNHAAEQVIYWAEKAQEVKHMNASDAALILFNLEVYRSTTQSRNIMVPLRELHMIHFVDAERGPAQAKLRARVLTLQEKEAEVRAYGEFTNEVQANVFMSVTPMRAVRDSRGNVIVFDGNGRIEAIRGAFPDMADVPVEVELLETRSPLVEPLLRQVMRMKGTDRTLLLPPPTGPPGT